MLLARLVLASFVLTAAGNALAADSTLTFVREGLEVASLDRRSLIAGCEVRVVEIAADPYYQRAKRFWACPLERVLELGFGAGTTVAEAHFFLRARDGYTKPATGESLASGGAYLALADADLTSRPQLLEVPRWDPIDRRQLDPAPYYVIWEGPEQNDPHRFPWPYQLARIEIAPFESEYPNTIPRGLPEGDPAWIGFGVFSRECVACHAVNGEGGRVGPELNVPRSVVEYRSSEVLRAFIRDPASFRYTSMPANAHLSDRELDALLDYFRAMSERKRDPGR